AVLGPDAPDDPDRSFFEAGGTSILAAQLHDRLVRDLGVGFDLVAIFGHPTQRAQAALIAAVEAAAAPSATEAAAGVAADAANRRRAAAALNRRRRVQAGPAVERQP